MIDFRYHLVSLVAVFMALAVGIALGAGPLKDPVDTALGNQTEELRKEKEELRAQVRALEAQLAFDQELATISAPSVLDGTLAGRTVLLVALPGSDAEQLELLKGAAEVAGARVSGTVAVQDSYTEPDQSGIFGDLVARLGGGGGRDPVRARRHRPGRRVGDRLRRGGRAGDPEWAGPAGRPRRDWLPRRRRHSRAAGHAGAHPGRPDPDEADAAKAQTAALLPLVAAFDEGGAARCSAGRSARPPRAA